MHAFLIAMALFGACQVLGILYELRWGESITWAGIAERFVSSALCGWAVVLLAMGN